MEPRAGYRRAKELLQERFGQKHKLAMTYLDRVLSCSTSLYHLESFSVDRCIKPPCFGNVVNSEVHYFSDASQSAYGSVSYLRLVNEEKQVHCALLMSKSRLAPLKKITIPRLELAATAVSVQLHKFLKSDLDIPIDTVRFWTDSMTVLRYLEQDSKRFHTYVANRVAYIRNDTQPNQLS